MDGTKISQTVANSGPGSLKFQEKRESFLSAATKLFNQAGIKGVTLGRCSVQLGLRNLEWTADLQLNPVKPFAGTSRFVNSGFMVLVFP